MSTSRRYVNLSAPHPRACFIDPFRVRSAHNGKRQANYAVNLCMIHVNGRLDAGMMRGMWYPFSSPKVNRYPKHLGRSAQQFQTFLRPRTFRTMSIADNHLFVIVTIWHRCTNSCKHISSMFNPPHEEFVKCSSRNSGAQFR